MGRFWMQRMVHPASACFLRPTAPDGVAEHRGPDGQRTPDQSRARSKRSRLPWVGKPAPAKVFDPAREWDPGSTEVIRKT